MPRNTKELLGSGIFAIVEVDKVGILPLDLMQSDSTEEEKNVNC